MKRISTLYTLVTLLALTGLAVSILLLVKNYYPGFGGIILCGKNCGALSSTPFSSILGIPLPVYSLYFFITVLIVEAGCLLYGKKSINFFITLMLLLYLPAVVLCIILGIVLVYYKIMCIWCISVYLIVFLSYGIIITALLKTGMNRNFKNVITSFFNSLNRRELWPAVFFLVIILLMLVPVLSAADIFIKKNATVMMTRSDNMNSFMDDFYKSTPVDLRLPIASIASGNEKARIKITVFTDFMCSACSKNHEVITRLIEKYPHDLYIQYYLYPLDSRCNDDISITLYKNSCVLSKYMVIASFEGIFPDLEKYYYDNYNAIKNSFRRGDYSVFKKFFSSRGRMIRPDIEREADNSISRDVKLAGILGIESTPVLFINGRKINGAYPYEYIESIIKKELLYK